MRSVLLVDCCLRGEASRTRRLARAFVSALPADCEVTHLDLSEVSPAPLTERTLAARDALLDAGRLDAPELALARQVADADIVVIAAPFWDLSFPALLKAYVENVSVEGITFRSTEHGLEGMCRGTDMVYLTTRGGFYKPDDPLEQGTPYLCALARFFGLGRFGCVAADGLDVEGIDAEGALADACARAAEIAATL